MKYLIFLLAFIPISSGYILAYSKKISDNPISWEQTNGPYSDKIISIASCSGSMYSCSDQNGVYISVNNGESWENIGLAGIGVLSVAVTNNQSVFAGTAIDGIFRSSGNGAWKQVNNGLSSKSIRIISINGKYIFAGTNSGGIFRSSDNGDNWTMVNQGLNANQVRAISFGNDNIIFAGTENGIFSSTDNGDSWSLKYSGVTVYALLQISGKEIFAGTHEGVFISYDSGITWSQSEYFKNIQVNALAADDHGNIYAGTSLKGVFLSYDKGSNWEEVNEGLINTSVYSLNMYSGNELFAGTEGGVYLFDYVKKTWIQKNTGLSPAVITSLIATSDNELFAGTVSSGIYYSDSKGNHWIPFNIGIANNLWVNNFAAGNDNRVYAATDSGIFIRVENKWIPSALLENVNCLSLSSGNIIFAGTENGIYYSNNEGMSWIECSLKKSINSILITPADHIYAAAADSIFISSDYGETWTGKYLPEVNCLAVNDDGFIFAGTYGGIFISKDEGMNWTQINENLRTLAIIVSKEGNIFAGTFGRGIYFSSDVGNNWNEINNGIKYGWVNSLVQSADNYLYAGITSPETYPVSGGGVLRSTEPVVYVDNRFDARKDKETPAVTNFPNPFNNQTSICFFNPIQSEISIIIYDITGAEVATLLKNKYYSPGNFTVNWDVNNISSGIYICCMFLNGERKAYAMKKINLIK